MKWEERLDYFKHDCDCADNIYEDIRDYLIVFLDLNRHIPF